MAEVQVTPETMTLAVGERQTLFATAYDRQGNLIPNARFTFWSSDTLVAKVGKEGAVVGASPGLAKVEARVQGRQASIAILITGNTPAQQAGSGLGRGHGPHPRARRRDAAPGREPAGRAPGACGRTAPRSCRGG